MYDNLVETIVFLCVFRCPLYIGQAIDSDTESVVPILSNVRYYSMVTSLYCPLYLLSSLPPVYWASEEAAPYILG